MKTIVLNLVRMTALPFALALALGGSVQSARADYAGLFVSATPQTPIRVGEPLNITVVVRNTGSFPWLSFELPAWLIQADNPSWSASWSLLNYVSWTDVNVDETATAIITLVPTELPVSPGDYSVRLNAAHNAYDLDLWLMNGNPKTVSFTVISPNRAPVLEPIGDKTAVESNALSFTVVATDPDVPPQRLTFSLEPGAPAGATINDTNGLFAWTPPVDHLPQINPITVRVTDNGSPPLSATRSFNVLVLKPPRFEPMTAPVDGVVTLRWRTYPGIAYRLQYKEDLVSSGWSNIGNDIVASGTVTSATNGMQGATHRFYQVLLLQ